MAKEEKEEVTEVVEEKELSDEFVDEKDKKKTKKKKNIIVSIFNFVLTIVIFGVVGMAVIDFINVNQEKEPMFCIHEEWTQYDDGTVELCVGVGYKVYRYNRESIKGSEFGPFWIEEKTKPLTVQE